MRGVRGVSLLKAVRRGGNWVFLWFGSRSERRLCCVSAWFEVWDSMVGLGMERSKVAGRRSGMGLEFSKGKVGHMQHTHRCRRQPQPWPLQTTTTTTPTHHHSQSPSISPRCHTAYERVIIETWYVFGLLTSKRSHQLVDEVADREKDMHELLQRSNSSSS